MNFVPSKEHTEVALVDGLRLLAFRKVDKLYSDGLDENEYIQKKSGGFYYEDDCFIGNSVGETNRTLLALKWPLSHKFYVLLNVV